MVAIMKKLFTEEELNQFRIADRLFKFHAQVNKIVREAVVRIIDGGDVDIELKLVTFEIAKELADAIKDAKTPLK